MFTVMLYMPALAMSMTYQQTDSYQSALAISEDLNKAGATSWVEGGSHSQGEY